MKSPMVHLVSFFAGVGLLIAAASAQRITRPASTIDLRTNEGAKLVQGQWRFAEAKVIEVDHHSVGADLKPTGPANRTNDIEPKAGAADFDDCEWEVIEPTSLEQRRSTGRLSFAWYRINVTIPEKVGNFETRGSTAYFEIVVDDYAEVWVDGQLPQVIGETGGAVITGWNAPNHLVVAKNVTPGQKIQLAIFAANGPLSDPPGNYIWIRSATLDFYKPQQPNFVETKIERLDSAIDEIIPPGAKLEKLADGFGFTEGPVWTENGLLFSDPNNNTIYRWLGGEVSVFRSHSGYTGADIGEYRQPGSNGLAIDPQGRLTICEHGNRRVTRLEKNGLLTVLADNFDGKRLNSPNDLVYRSDGALFFTDPPFGLPKAFDDARKQLDFSGVYCLKDGKLSVVSKDFTGPNGLAFSPDEKYLYVDNWDPKKKVVMRYDVAADGSLSNGRVFFDITSTPGELAFDGLKVDQRGNVYVSGPAGIYVLSAAGTLLGTIHGPELSANFAWGDTDGRTLYLTARTGLYRIRILVAGVTAPSTLTAMK